MRLFFYALILAFLAACTTTPKAPTVEAPPSRPEVSQGGAVSIDYVALQRSLGMDTPSHELGYKEKAFDTCKVGYGYSSTHGCRRELMVVINFHLQCRDSVGTVAEGVTSSDLTAIANKNVRWNLKGKQGTAKTDSEGFGQIMTVSAYSQKRERLKLGVGNEFLYMRANEITRVVTPRPWCEQ